MDIKIEDLRTLCRRGNIKWSIHALKRMRERQITSDDFKNCIMTGEIIEQYPTDRPLPSCLIFGSSQKIYLHVVCGTDGIFIYAITAYIPDENEWQPDLKTRKEN